MRVLTVLGVVAVALAATGEGRKKQKQSKNFDMRKLGIQMKAEKVARSIKIFFRQQLQLDDVQEIVNGAPFEKLSIAYANITKGAAETLNETLAEYLKALHKNKKTFLMASQQQNGLHFTPRGKIRECCRLNSGNLKYNKQFGAAVNLSYTCDVISAEEEFFQFYPLEKLTKVQRRNAEILAGLKWQYFISRRGSHVEFPAHSLTYNNFGSFPSFAARNEPKHVDTESEAMNKCLKAEACLHRPQFIGAALPYAKYAVILMEHGSATLPSQRAKMKAVTAFLLQNFNRHDKITVVGLTTSTKLMCSGRLINATWENKQKFVRFIQRLPASSFAYSNHSLGFEKAFKIFESENLTRSGQQLYIFYVSRGILFRIDDASQILATIANAKLRTGLYDVRINTVAVILRGKAPLWETQLLQDIASQNFAKYKGNFNDSRLIERIENHNRLVHPTKGKMLVVNGSEELELTLRKLYESLERKEQLKNVSLEDYVFWSEPYLDPSAEQNALGSPYTASSPSIIVSIAEPIWFNRQFFGVAGVDVALDVITAHFRHSLWNKGGRFSPPATKMNRYFSLIDTDGYVVYHPLVERRYKFWPAKFAKLEQWLDSVSNRALIRKMTTESSGFDTATLIRDNRTTRAVYYWEKVENAPFVVVLAVFTEVHGYEDALDWSKDGKVEANLRGAPITYHRLDLRMSSKVETYCMNGKQLCTKDLGSIFLSPACFKWPFARILRGESAKSARNYWLYLVSGGAVPFVNPGLRPFVKEDVVLLSRMVEKWRSQNGDEGILRRFAATRRGVLATFPAGLIGINFEPTKREWFRVAAENPGKLIVSKPSLDPTGLGYVVTLSSALVAVNSKSEVVAVVGADVSVNFLYSLLVDAVESCAGPKERCMLLDSRGYLLAIGDPLLTRKSNGKEGKSGAVGGGKSKGEPPESMHVTHRLPTMAAALLNTPRVFRKQLCERHADRTVQRWYYLNATQPQLLKDGGGDATTEHGDYVCERYQLASISEVLGVYLGVVVSEEEEEGGQQQCDKGGVEAEELFCPCSISDRQCMICSKKVDYDECECPCQCPLFRFGRCQEEQEKQESLPVCSSPESAPFSLPPLQTFVERRQTTKKNKKSARLLLTSRQTLLPSCNQQQRTCAAHSALGWKACLRVVGCEWCLREADGVTLLERPYCADTSRCFGGVEGRSVFGRMVTPAASNPMSSPVGPAAIAVVALFLVLFVVLIYWYRHHVNRLAGQNRGSGARLHLTNHDCNEETEFEFDHDGSKPDGGDECCCNELENSALSNVLLASFERDRLTNTVPRPRYRQGPRTESSDHGYSTMTDRNCDDSERGTTIEPLSPQFGGGAKYQLASRLSEEPLQLKSERSLDESSSASTGACSTLKLAAGRRRTSLDSLTDDIVETGKFADSTNPTCHDAEIAAPPTNIITTTALVHAS